MLALWLATTSTTRWTAAFRPDADVPVTWILCCPLLEGRRTVARKVPSAPASADTAASGLCGSSTISTLEPTLNPDPEILISLPACACSGAFTDGLWGGGAAMTAAGGLWGFSSGLSWLERWASVPAGLPAVLTVVVLSVVVLVVPTGLAARWALLTACEDDVALLGRAVVVAERMGAGRVELGAVVAVVAVSAARLLVACVVAVVAGSASGGLSGALVVVAAGAVREGKGPWTVEEVP